MAKPRSLVAVAFGLSFLLVSPPASPPGPLDPAAGPPAVPQSSLASELARREYQARANERGLQAPNRAHNLRSYFGPRGVRVHDRTAAGSPELVALELAAVGRDETRRDATPGEVRAEGARVEIDRGEVVEWYVNSPAGLEQGFDLVTRPEGRGELRLELALSGAHARADGGAIELDTATGRHLRYAKLAAYDARSRALPARMELTEPARLALVVDDSDAVYPVTIDPLLYQPDRRLNGAQAGAQLGIRIASAGDVNGDGFADVIAGAPSYDAGDLNEGAAFVFLGSAGGIADAEAAGAAAQLESNQSDSLFGRAVGGAGDVNGDGYDDVIVGARQYDSPSADEGAAFVFLGGPGGVEDGNPLTAASVVQSNQTNGELGSCVAGAGDVNGDGYGDVIIGAWFYSAGGPSSEGAAFLFHGGASGIVVAGNPLNAVTRLESNQSGSSFGATCASAGDVNADGYADVIVGARDFDNPETNEGAAFVFLGSSSGVASADPVTAHALLETDQANAELGWDVDGAGDVNGDGYSDVIAGAIGYDAGETNEGAAFVFLGSFSGVGDGNPTTAALRIESDQANAQLFGVGGAGDVNGDGYGDLVVGAHLHDDDPNVPTNDEGLAMVFLGGAFLPAVGNPANAYFVFDPSLPGTAPHAGHDVAGAGDVNGDGYADVLVGAQLYDDAFTDSGAVFVFHGGNEGILTGDLATAPAQVEANQDDAQLGTSIANAGDVNGDGYYDVIVGAPLFDSGVIDEGAAFVYLGQPFGLTLPAPDATLLSGQANSRFGGTVAGAGDVNGDGYADVIVGAARYNAGQTLEGSAFVFHGGLGGIVGTGPASAAARLESDEAGAQLGEPVAGAGDVNGDGYADVIVGAPQIFGLRGEALVFHGGPGGVGNRNRAAADARLTSPVPGGGLGTSVAGAGDVNGDGYADVIAGKPSGGGASEAFVFHGGPAGVGNRSTTAADTRLWAELDSGLGRSAASAGDVNADGFADVIVGAPGYPGFALAEAYVFAGSPSGIAYTYAEFPFDGLARLSAASSSDGFGSSVASAGDVNGDGYADVVVGAPTSGKVYVALGPSLVGLHEIAGPSGARLGTSVAGADVNGDGFSDVLAGAPWFQNPNVREGGLFLLLDTLGRSPQARQLRPTTSFVRVQPFGSSRNISTFRVRMRVHSPFARTRAKLEVQACPQGLAFGHAGCSSASSAWTDTQTAGALLVVDVTGLAPGVLYRWRARPAFAPTAFAGGGVALPPNPAHGRWVRVGAQAVEGDIRVEPDPDGDGVGTSSDNCPLISNAGQQDSDLDGDGDLCDNCPLAADPTQANSDGDALGDVCDPDDDNDGLNDSAEPGYGTNPFDADSDDDGASDGEEVNEGSNPLDYDTDDDSVVDGPDNCPNLANPLQTDSDADTQGDGCDNCRIGANPDQADRGGLNSPTPDGVGDVCQNGDWNGDGVSNLVDVVIHRRVLAGAQTVDPRLPPGP